MAEVYEFSKVPSGTLNINTLFSYIPNALKSLNTDPGEVLEFLMNEFKTLRGRSKNESLFSQYLLFPTLKVFSSRMNDKGNLFQMISNDLNQNKTNVIEIKWDVNPTNENIFKILSSILTSLENFEISGIIGYNGCFYTPIIKTLDK